MIYNGKSLYILWSGFLCFKGGKIMFTQEQIQPTESIGTASKHPARLRNKEFLIRFTQEEFDELNYYVKKSGKARADFILSLIQQDKIVIIDDLSKVWNELHRQGNNLNQIAKAMNTYCLLLQEFKTPEYDVDDYIKAFTRQLRSTQQEFNQLTSCVKEIMERIV